MDTLIQDDANPLSEAEAKNRASLDNGSNASAPKENNNELTEQIAVCAYFKAEARGYVPGFELQDWLEAESELKAQ